MNQSSIDQLREENERLRSELKAARASMRTAQSSSQQAASLKQSEERYKALFEQTADYVLVLDPTQGEIPIIVDGNSAAFLKHGYQKDELIGQPISILDANLNEAMVEERVQGVQSNQPIHFEAEHRRKDGSTFFVDIALQKVTIGGKDLLYAVERDITDRKQAEDQVRTYADIVQNMQIGLLVFHVDNLDDEDEPCRLVDFNPAAFELTGTSIEALIGKTIDECFPGLQTLELPKRYRDVLRTGEPLGIDDIPFINPQGEEGSYSIRIFPLPNQYIGIAFEDSSKRTRAESELRRSEANLRSIFDSMQDTFFRANLDGEITEVSPSACTLLQCSRVDEIIGKQVTDFYVHPYEVEKLLKELKNNNGIVQSFESTLRCFDGQHVIAATNAHYCRDDLGRIRGFEGTVRDITTRKKAEEKLRKMSRALDEAGESVLITDCHGIIEYVNPAFTAITGYHEDEVIGKDPSILKSEAQDPAYYKELWETITAGNTWHGTLIDRRKDGSFYPALMSIAPIHNQNGEITHYVSTQRDMSEHQKLEDQLIQSQKMEAIGTLVGGIAHDFNNMLAALQGNIYLAKQTVTGQPQTSERLSNVESLISTAAGVVRQLLTFARKDSVRMQPFCLNDFMKDGFKLAETAIPENIEHECDLCEEEIIIKGDSNQLQQALMNLLINAKDAVSETEGAKIKCSLHPFEISEEFLTLHPELKGMHYSRLSVSDNGCGIANERLHKIFEPFFTTKEVGKGTGLGLAMVYGAIQRHGGVVEVESKLGGGTTFHVYLPRLQNKPAKEESSAIESSPGHGECILLVDDEKSLRTTTREVLQCLGYRVIEAENGSAAFELFIDPANSVDLIITDLVMPVQNGHTLAERVRRIDSRVPIIFVTGYDREDASYLGEEITHSILLNKPFEFDPLSQTIRAMLKSAK